MGLRWERLGLWCVERGWSATPVLFCLRALVFPMMSGVVPSEPTAQKRDDALGPLDPLSTLNVCTVIARQGVTATPVNMKFYISYPVE